MTPFSLIALLAAAAAPAPPPPSPPPSLSAPSPVVQMEHVSIQSIGSGPPVVLIPGLATPREVYSGIAAELARGRRVLLVQVNGFGGDAPRGNGKGPILDGVVADIAAYLRRERLQAAAVVGHSMGGLLGMRLARDHAPLIDRLMIVDAFPFIGTMFAPGATVETIRPAAEAMRQAYVAAAARPREPSADGPMLAAMSITPAGRRQVSAWSIAANPQVAAQAMYEVMQEDLRPHLPAIARVPTTVLYAVPPQLAERSRAMWTGAYSAAPSVRTVAVEDSHHFIMIDQPERFAREVAAFLER